MAKKRGRSRKRRKKNSKKALSRGIIEIQRNGYAFVNTSEGEFHIPKRDVHHAMDGDLVDVRPVRGRKKGKRREAYVVNVVEREHHSFIARFESDKKGHVRALVPLDDKLAHDFFVEPTDTTPDKFNVHHGDIVLASILIYPTKKSAGVATIKEFVSDKENTASMIRSLIVSLGLKETFSESALREADQLNLDVSQALADKERKDLRDLFVFTIDPTDAKDFDDAVSITRKAQGGWELGVHIADVSHYVRYGSAIDKEARARATSVYLVDRVLPMLPEKISNDLCSLRPNEDRLTVSVFMQLDETGTVQSSTMTPSVIRSRARLDYDTVDMLLNRKNPQSVSGQNMQQKACVAAEKEGKDLLTILDDLNHVAHLRKKIREQRGAVNFETTEAKVKLDENEVPIAIEVRRQTNATALIEEAMLLANESVAHYLATRDLSAAYRVHEQPSEEALASVIPLLQEFNLSSDERVEGLLAGNPFVLQNIIKEVSGKPEEFLFNDTLLRSMKKAVYKPDNGGHYALGADAYCHFTSPIRRYPDLVVHRVLKENLNLDRDTQDPNYYEMIDHLVPICQVSSEMERAAMTASFKSQEIKMAEYYSYRIGNEYKGIVVSVGTFGVFVRLNETTAEGLIPIRELGDEWFEHSEVSQMLTGEETGTRYRLGMSVVVRVTSVNIPEGQINFSLA